MLENEVAPTDTEIKAPEQVATEAPAAPKEEVIESDGPLTAEKLEQMVEKKKSPITPVDAAKDTSKETAQHAAPVPEAYKPNFTYNVRRKEHTFPEALKEVIKSKEDENYWRDVFTKADALEPIKADRERLEQQYNGLAQPMTEFYKELQFGNLKKAYQIAEIEPPTVTQLVREFGLKPEDVAAELLGLVSLTPEQHALHNKAIEAERRAVMAEHQISQVEAQSRQNLQSQVEFSVQQVLSEQTVAPIAQAFDQRNGQGAFLNLVAQHGDQIYRSTGGQIVHPNEVVKQIIHTYGLESLLTQSQQPAPAVQNVQPQALQTVKPQTKAPSQVLPTIPVVGEGSTGSPVKRRITSVADIEREYNEYK
jgi:hypothetical protein